MSQDSSQKRKSKEVEVQGSSSTARQFPEGMRILLVDDCRCTLTSLKMMLISCKYRVTTCSGGIEALELLKANRNQFDLVLSDIHMPDLDGIRLIKAIRPEIETPVVLMSGDKRDNLIVEGMNIGACDFLIKPGHMEQYRNIWKHAYKKKDVQDDKAIKITSQTETAETVNDNTESEDKKSRVKWTADLHKKFINAVNVLGIDKAVPKRVLELMDVTCLTKENVASHLQKFRIYLKKAEYEKSGEISPKTIAAVSPFILNSADYERRPPTRNGITIREPCPNAAQEIPQQLSMQPSSSRQPTTQKYSPVSHQGLLQLNQEFSNIRQAIPQNFRMAVRPCPPPLISQPSCKRPAIPDYSSITLRKPQHPLNLQPLHIPPDQSPQTLQESFPTQEQASLQGMRNPLLMNQNSASRLLQTIGFSQNGVVPQTPRQNYWTMNLVHRGPAENIPVSINAESKTTTLSQSIGYPGGGVPPTLPSNSWSINNPVYMTHLENIHVQKPNYTRSEILISAEGTGNDGIIKNYPSHESVSFMEIENSGNQGYRDEGLDYGAIIQNNQNCGSVTTVGNKTPDQGQASNHGFAGEGSEGQKAPEKIIPPEFNSSIHEDVEAEDFLSAILSIHTDDSGPNLSDILNIPKDESSLELYDTFKFPKDDSSPNQW